MDLSDKEKDFNKNLIEATEINKKKDSKTEFEEI